MARVYDYDLIVIGAGIAGFVSAVTANGIGKRVAVVEKRKVGGNCTNYTCVPSKSLIRLSHLNREIEYFSHLGLWSGPVPLINGPYAMDHIRSVVQRAYEKDLPETFERIGIRVITGLASFVDPHCIKVNEKVFSSEKFIIASGTQPLIPPINGLKDIDYLTNENLYELDDMPGSIVILGGGVDGLEYASAFGRLGVKTTMVEMGTRLLPMAERELVNILTKTLEIEGIRILSGAKAVSLSSCQNGVKLVFEQGTENFGEIEADRVLVAIGRKPDIADLMLEKAGVDYSPKGILSNNKLQTSNPNIYACGDVVGPYQLASMAEYQGIIAATNAFSPFKQKVNYRDNVYVIFTEPPIAFIGLTEEQALKKHGVGLKVYRFNYSNMRRAMIDGHPTGLAKVMCDRKGRIVGAHIIGESAAEVIHEIQVIKSLNVPLYKLHSVTHAYPTYAQAVVGRAAQLNYLDRMSKSWFVSIGLKLLPGFANRLNLARDRLAEKELPPVSPKTATLDMVTQSEGQPVKEFLSKAVRLGSKGCVAVLPESLTDCSEDAIVLACVGGAGSGQSQLRTLDFSNVQTINGLGASMLAKLSAKAGCQGQKLTAFGLDSGLRDIFAVTQLDQVIEICPDEKAALMTTRFDATKRDHDFEEQVGEQRVDTRYWAKVVDSLTVPPMPKEARNLNVDGLGITSPVKGFGQLWQKTYRLHIHDHSISPENIIEVLKQNFTKFQPSFNHFYPSPEGIKPGEIVLIDSMTPGGPVSTGVMILYADRLSFTFCTPQGHPEAGWVSFSASLTDEGTIMQIYGLTRSNDPVFEAAFHLLGSKMQVQIWTHVLSSLAAYLGVPPEITMESKCVDTNMQWEHIGNIWYNSQIRTLIREPLRWVRLTQEYFARNKSNDT
ncbi:MAG: FAD-dependent oxidoreductase [Desulfomonilaceae bacterium]